MAAPHKAAKPPRRALGERRCSPGRGSCRREGTRGSQPVQKDDKDCRDVRGGTVTVGSGMGANPSGRHGQAGAVSSNQGPADVLPGGELVSVLGNGGRCGRGAGRSKSWGVSVRLRPAPGGSERGRAPFRERPGSAAPERGPA